MQKKGNKFNEDLIKISIKHFIKKPSLVGLIILVICFGVYFLEQNKISDVPLNSSSSEIISSNFRIVDGDTIIINNIKIRLQGIDAPELKQKCMLKQTNQLYACGESAKNYLITLIDHQTVKCKREGIDRYTRILAYCYVGEVNLNKEMVSSGNAVAYRKYDKSFIEDEMHAKSQEIGIWASKFEEPEKWRSKNK